MNTDDTHSPEEFRAWSAALRAGMVAYGFLPTEVLLLLILCEETFDRNELAARADVPAWARRLGMRPDKLRPVWEELIGIQVVDFNAAAGWYQLRPALESWTNVRALRVPRNLRAGAELPLKLERPIDEALSSMSREQALLAPRGALSGAGDSPAPSGSQLSGRQTALEWHRQIRASHPASEWPAFQAEFEMRLAAEKSAGPGENIPEKLSAASADFSAARKSPALTAVLRGRAGPVEKSAALPYRVTSLVSAVPETSLVSREEKSAAACRWIGDVDTENCLAQMNCRQQWEELCNRDPDYVLTKLKKALRLAMATTEIRNPLGFLARKCRDDRKF